MLPQPPAVYIFVDAGLPRRQPMSRLAAIQAEGGAWVDEFEVLLAAGGRFPNWTADDLAVTLSNDQQWRNLIDGLRLRGRAFFEEVLAGTLDVGELPGRLPATDSRLAGLPQAGKPLGLAGPALGRRALRDDRYPGRDCRTLAGAG